LALILGSGKRQVNEEGHLAGEVRINTETVHVNTRTADARLASFFWGTGTQHTWPSELPALHNSIGGNGAFAALAIESGETRLDPFVGELEPPGNPSFRLFIR